MKPAAYLTENNQYSINVIFEYNLLNSEDRSHLGKWEIVKLFPRKRILSETNGKKQWSTKEKNAILFNTPEEALKCLNKFLKQEKQNEG